MKKILFLLLCTVSMYGQTYQNPTFGTVKTMTNTESSTATKINAQETDGKINWLQPINIPIPISPINYAPTSPTLGGHLGGIDLKLGTVTDALNTLNTLKASLDLDPIVVNSTQGYFTKGDVPFIHNFYAGVNPLQGGTGNNLNIGVNSGNFNSDNFNYASTMVGFESGMSNKNGYSNVGIGYRNLHLNQNGFGNSALGTYVLGKLTSGTQNTAIGWHAMLYSTTASENTAIGVEALWKNLTGLRNLAIGMRAGSENLGDDNLFLGYNAGASYTGSNKLYIANINRTLIGGDFSGDGFIRLNGAGEFVVAPSRKITFKNPTGGEASLGWFNDLNAETNAYLDAFDYRIRTGGVVRLQIANNGAATFSNNITTIPATTANHVVVKSQLDLKADINSQTFTGDPKAPTATAGDNDTSIATTAFVSNVASSGVVAITNTGNWSFSKSYYTKIGKVVSMVINGTYSSPISGSATITLPNSFSINSPVNGRIIGKTIGSIAGSMTVVPVYISENVTNTQIQISIDTSTANAVFSVPFTFLSN